MWPCEGVEQKLKRVRCKLIDDISRNGKEAHLGH